MSNELICIVSLSVLCIFWSYRFWKLEKLVFAQFDKILNFQHDVKADMIDALTNFFESDIIGYIKKYASEHENKIQEMNEKRNQDDRMEN